MFKPYHTFQNCKRLEVQVRKLREDSAASGESIAAYNRYHFALLHKLKTAKYNVDRLESILTSPTEEDIASSNSRDLLFKVNMRIDGFLIAGGSVLDILGREVLSYYGIRIQNDVYFRTAREELVRHIPNDPIIGHLADPSWRDAFSNYRNSITHEVLIVSQYSIDVVFDGDTQRTRRRIPLPDDPRTDMANRTYNINPDSLEYCSTTLRRILRLTNQVYGDIANRLRLENQLPLPLP